MSADLTVHPPRQARTRKQWDQILDAGVEILEAEGAAGFTIAAVCERAGVVPRAVYARAASKEALFFAVYERGMQRVLATESALADPSACVDMDAAETIAHAVRAVSSVYIRNHRFLSAVILASGPDDELSRRGAAYIAAAQESFTRLVLLHADQITHAAPELAVRRCFGDLAGTLIVRTAYGPGWGAPPMTDAEHAEHLVDLALRFLLGKSEWLTAT